MNREKNHRTAEIIAIIFFELIVPVICSGIGVYIGLKIFGVL